jgi:hypothetical protein
MALLGGGAVAGRSSTQPAVKADDSANADSLS